MTIPISASVPACRRESHLRATLSKILACMPPPAEILVHIDGNSTRLCSLVAQEFPQARLVISSTFIGPGGARNRLTQEARYSWIAHFDDDSFPLDADYFARAWALISKMPETAVFCASILPFEVPDTQGLWLQAFYPGCGHLMNREWFMKTRGYQPVPIAYNMEEVDVSLQLHELGGMCLQSGELRVFHDHLPPEREDENTQVAMMINTVIFPLLRYPVALWPQACGSIVRRLLRLALNGELKVIGRSFLALPGAVRKYFPLRAPVKFASALSWLLLRRSPVRVAAVSSPASS